VKRSCFVFQLHLGRASADAIRPAQLHRTFESIIYYNPSTHLTIVRCRREDKHLLQTSATFLTRLTDHSVPCSFQTLHVSGSIRQAKKYLVNYSIEQLVQIDNAAKQISSTSLFKQKKKKYQSPTPTNTTNDKEKQQTPQKLLAESRIEAISMIEINHGPADE
jgi:hypothetical protein